MRRSRSGSALRSARKHQRPLRDSTAHSTPSNGFTGFGTSTRCFRLGRVPPHIVSKWLGHTNVRITMGIYAHLFPSDDRETADRVAAIMFGT